MKHLLLIFLIFGSLAARAQVPSLVKRWSFNSACLMPAGKWESGLLQPFRYGISKNLEVNTNSLLLPVLPDAGIKLALGEKCGFRLAGEHSLSVPSVFLNFVSRKGIGGLISPQFHFPFMLALNNSLLASKFLPDSILLTLKAGLAFTVRSGKADPLSTIDLPVFYPRMAHYYKGLSFRFSSGIRGSICRKWNYEEAAQVFLITRAEHYFFAENTGNLMWSVGRSLRIKGGYNLSYGNYPFGKHWQLWPSLDLVFGSRVL